MQFENPMTFVRAIKGAPASILFAFFYTRRVMTALELQQWTGYKGDNITVAVRLLVDLGWLAARSPRGPWCLIEGRQLPLMNLLEETQRNFAVESDLIGFEDEPLIIINSSSTYLTDPVNNNNKSLTPIKSDSGQMSAFRTPAELDALKGALNKHKIVGGKRAELIACEWVTAEYVHANVEFALADGKEAGRTVAWSIGIAINCMLDGIDQPGRRQNGHIENCTCQECSSQIDTQGYAMDLMKCVDCGAYPCECEHDVNCECIECKRNHPERFCQFAIVQDGEMLSRGNMRPGWTRTCGRLLVPEHKFCSEHEEEE